MSQIKTAISIDQGIFKIIDSLAKKIHVSRSHLFEVAAREWVKRERDKDLTERINRAVEKNHSNLEDVKRSEQMRRHYRKLFEGDKW